MTADGVVFVDTETDGVRHGRRTWEVSLISRRATEGEAEMTIIITDSGVSGREEPRALEVNRFEERFNRELVRGEVRMPGARAAAVISAVTTNAWLIAAQPQFDEVNLARLLRWYGIEPTWQRRLRDIESMTEEHLDQFGIGGLQACAKALEIDVDPAVVHTSLGDARLVRDCFDRIFPEVPF